MYLKYTVTNGTYEQVQTEIGDLLMGDITDQTSTVYGTAVIDGTLPTAGIYTRTTSNVDVNLKLTKKHCQWHVSTLPASCVLQVFSDNGAYATLSVADQNGANAAYNYYHNNQSSMNLASITAGTEYHFIINDTTFALTSIQPNTAGGAAQRYGGTIFSDFEKTPYDEYAIGENPLYYPGGALGWTNKNPEVKEIEVDSAGFSAYRFQFQNTATGLFQNSVIASQVYNQFNLTGWAVQQNSNPYFSCMPDPSKPLWKTWGTGGHTIAMIPIMINGHQQGWVGPSSGYLTNLGIDSRWHNVMLNTYRMSSGTGVTGDFVESADTSRYYIMAGHRSKTTGPQVSSNTQYSTTGNQLQVLYAFPKDNVPIV
tara:strand:+ start:909 stop:2012 length:1104 start_codon:yes stop_codon:yes gene_type:complete